MDSCFLTFFCHVIDPCSFICTTAPFYFNVFNTILNTQIINFCGSWQLFSFALIFFLLFSPMCDLTKNLHFTLRQENNQPLHIHHCLSTFVASVISFRFLLLSTQATDHEKEALFYSISDFWLVQCLPDIFCVWVYETHEHWCLL